MKGSSQAGCCPIRHLAASGYQIQGAQPAHHARPSSPARSLDLLSFDYAAKTAEKPAKSRRGEGNGVDWSRGEPTVREKHGQQAVAARSRGELPRWFIAALTLLSVPNGTA